MTAISYLLMDAMNVVINVFNIVLIAEKIYVMNVIQLVGLMITKLNYVFLFVEMEKLMDMNNVMTETKLKMMVVVILVNINVIWHVLIVIKVNV